MKSLLLLLIAPSVALAVAPHVGIVDEQEIFKKYAKAADLQVEIRKSEETAQASVNERLKAVQVKETELQAIDKRGQDPMLSENGKKAVGAEFQQKNAEYQKARAELQTFVNEARNVIQQRVAEMNKQILADAKIQAEKVSKAKGLTLVLGKAPVLFSDASLDITEDILKELNAAYKATAPVVAPPSLAPPVVAPVAPAAGDKPAAK